MHCYLKIVFAFLILSLANSVYAQQPGWTDSTHTLKEVVLSSNRLQNFSTGNKIQSIDSSSLQNNTSNTLADLLASESQVFVKSYGITGMATPSFRGSGANHTAILWNGFNISSPMSGQLDLVLVPVNFVNSVKLQYGGSSALWGSGAIGGTIHLNNVPEFDNGININSTSTYGSFADKQQNLEFSLSKKRFISSTKVFYHDAKNDFPFINTAQYGRPEQRLGNAALKQYGLLQENYFKISSNQKLSIRFWHQFNDREIPASMTVARSLANQKDKFYRTTAEWSYTKSKYTAFVRAAYFDEYLGYTDPLISLISNSHSKVIITEAESRIKLRSNQSLNIGVNNTNNQAISKNYIRNPHQNRTAFFASYKISNKRNSLKGTASVRKEFITNGDNPLTASAGLEGRVFRKFRLRGSISKNYRLPTFNDLYWTPGGNPNLLPESGWSQEAGLSFVHCVDKFSVEAEATTFSNKVNNWIMWRPGNTGLWSPENVLSVWSRGIEYDLKTHYEIHKVTFSFTARYQYIFSTNEKLNTGDEATLHKQLIYVPVEKAQGSIGAAYNGYKLSWSYNYVGYRYTTSDNSRYLDPYQLSNLDLSKEFNLKSVKLKAFVQVNNLWNEAYQIIAFYPMPGRYYQAGISINYHKANK